MRDLLSVGECGQLFDLYGSLSVNAVFRLGCRVVYPRLLKSSAKILKSEPLIFAPDLNAIARSENGVPFNAADKRNR